MLILAEATRKCCKGLARARLVRAVATVSVLLGTGT